MKYQQLENLESGWKWKYLVKKHREGELITRYIEASAAQAAVDDLLTLENEPVLVHAWIEQHMNPALMNRMKQTIRARRKRHFNAEHQHTRKKSIDLEFVVWQRLAGLAQRREDIAPNVEYELQRFATQTQSQVRFDKEARERYLRFADSPQALWRGNFRELGSSVARMATLAEQGRITLALVEEEIVRLQESWQTAAPSPVMDLDLFDQRQLETVLEVCRRSASLSEAGRELFAVSRMKKANPNDADRLRKYLARFGLSWEHLHPGS